MANVNSLSSSSSGASSLYGNRNVLSGLASGLDTETLIENSVSGYKSKITSLQQEQEQITWKQDAVRSITDQMAGVLSSFTSYTSKTNLYSESFFTSAISTEAQGTNAGKVFAAGKSTSQVQVNGVASLASAARYSVKAFKGAVNNASEDIDWNNWADKTKDKKFTVTFDGAVKTFSFNDLKSRLESALKKQVGDSATLDSATAEEKTKALSTAMGELFDAKFGAGRIEVGSSGSTLNFNVASGGYISIGSEEESALGVNGLISNELSTKRLGQIMEGAQNIGSWKLTVNDTEITGISASSTLQDVLSAINSSDAGVTASFSALTGQFSFVSKATGASSEIDIGGEWGSALFTGLADQEKMENISLRDAFGVSGTVSAAYLTATYGEGSNIAIPMEPLSLTETTNGTTSDSTLVKLQEWLETGGIHVNYDKEGYHFSADDPAKLENFRIVDGLGGKSYSLEDLFHTHNSVYTKGTDAVMNVTINGQDLTLSRATNTVELDGMEVTLRDTFNMDAKTGAVGSKADAVTFTTRTDTEKVVDAVKSFVEQLNSVMTDVRSAFTTKPLELNASKHTKYMPLTEEDKNSMSETAVKNYEEKAKTGLLYGDSDLKNLYSQLVSLATSSGEDRIAREAIGITTNYSNGATTINLDESALRAALEKDPDSVRKVFTNPLSENAQRALQEKTAASEGKSVSQVEAVSNTGWMETIKTLFSNYASTSVASPGILVKKAGSKLSALSLNDNTFQDQINALSTKIEDWQTKMGSKIDFYTKQFTAMEQLISTMNNQSSMLAGLTGGY